MADSPETRTRQSDIAETLFVAEPELAREVPVDVRRYTEAEMVGLLRARYGQRSGNGPKWALVPHVRNGAGWGGSTGFGGLRTCDAIAVALWSSEGLGLHGHEIKVSRADWLRELADPNKSSAFRRYCDKWWLVAPPGVVAEGELPEGWGLLEVVGKLGTERLQARTQAPRVDAESLPRGVVAALVRAAIRGGSLGGEQIGLQPVDPELARLNDQIAAAEQAYDQALADPVCEGLDRAGAVLARLYARKRELTTVKEPA